MVSLFGLLLPSSESTTVTKARVRKSMRKSKGKKKKTSGTNLKTSPLKTYKKQVKRMKNRLKGIPFEELGSNLALVTKYKTRLDGAELHLRNYDKEQEQKRADEMRVRASKK
jgi:hypothetical protein